MTIFALCFLMLAVVILTFGAARSIRVQTRLVADLKADEAIRIRQEVALLAVVTPLVWIEQAAQGDDEASRRNRHAAVSALQSVATGLGLSEEDMGDAVASVANPPRRLPRYPQVPSYLARPSDVAQVPPMKATLTPEAKAAFEEGHYLGREALQAPEATDD